MGADDTAMVISVATIRSAALDILTGREYSRQELAQKLQRKFGHHSSIDEVLNGLETDQLQSDRRYAEVFVRSRIQRGQGPIKIRADIGQKGISNEILQLVLNEQKIDWFSVVCDVSRRKYGVLGPQEQSDKARRGRFFQSRGFTFEQISRVLKQISED